MNIRIDKINSYMNYARSYDSYINYSHSNKKVKNNYAEAIQISIFDSSYEYVATINNMLYMKKNGILYKVDVSNCSPVRIASLISYLNE